MNEQILALINELGEDKAIKVLTREINTLKRIEKQKQKDIEESKKIKHIELDGINGARIEEINLSSGAYLGLLNAKIFYVRDLIKYSKGDLIKIKGMTKLRISKLEENLKQYGLKLRDE